MKKNKTKFELEVEGILKPYFYLLVEVENIANMNDKKPITTKSFRDMLNVCKIIKKPIYYVVKENMYNFVLYDKEEVYFYTLKSTESANKLLENIDDLETLNETIRFSPIDTKMYNDKEII